MAYNVYRLGLHIGTFPNIDAAHAHIARHEAANILHLLTDYTTEYVNAR
jgi:hypothetical protein